MVQMPEKSEFNVLPRAEKERLFLDVIKTPPFAAQGTWGEWFHAWLEDQAAEGLSLGQIASRIDLPNYMDALASGPWELLDNHVEWMIENGFARVVYIQVIA